MGAENEFAKLKIKVMLNLTHKNLEAYQCTIWNFINIELFKKEEMGG